MYIVKNSPRALFAALIPLALVEAVLLAFALAGGQVTDPVGTPTPDRVLLTYAGRMALDAALLFVGHIMLRQWTISSRLAYGLMGGVMAGVSYAIAMRNNLQFGSPADGTLLTIGLLPTLAGLLSGFLYGQFAGLVLAPARRRTGSASTAVDAAAPESATPALVFDGPVRVRTSVAGVAIASVTPAALATLLPYTLLPLLMRGFENKTNVEIFAALIPAQTFLTMLVVTTVPSAIFTLCMHHVARALDRRLVRDYVLVGAAMAFACAVLIAFALPLFAVLVIPAAICGAIMGALYRRFAGLEPVPLPEAVIATDPNALVGADHPSRRQRSVILGN